VINRNNSGNLVSKAAKTPGKLSFQYSYSSKNQLTEIKEYDLLGGPVLKQVNYIYDVLGRRMEKKIIDYGSNPATVKTRRYLYDGDNVIAEYNGNNQLLATFTHSLLAPDDILSSNITYTGTEEGIASQPASFYYLKDALGSITDLVSADGNIIQSYQYSSFGKILSIKDELGNNLPTARISQSYAFTGREWDQEAGLYFYRARSYDPYVGRFIQEDPHPGQLMFPVSLFNKYIYSANAPVQFRDPTGQSILGDLFSGILDLGHSFIADFGSSFDTLIKNKGVQTVIVAVVAVVLAIYFGVPPETAISSGIGALTTTAITGEVTPEQFLINFSANLLLAPVFNKFTSLIGISGGFAGTPIANGIAKGVIFSAPGAVLTKELLPQR